MRANPFDIVWIALALHSIMVPFYIQHMFMAREHHEILSPHIHFRDELHGEVKK